MGDLFRETDAQKDEDMHTYGGRGKKIGVPIRHWIQLENIGASKSVSRNLRWSI